ncbi:MAG TPA: 50S ribosomal protein L25 [Blastocatellia bacterium]|nr:50S ribosomal protein L25 [Blastocatellia bacterium]
MSLDTNISLNAQPRTEKGKGAAGRLRRSGLIPVTVYGGGKETVSASIVKRELGAFVRAHGRHGIFTLHLEGGSSPVKIAEMQLDPIKGGVRHLDLQRISLTERSEFEVALKIVGEAEGVKTFGGIMDVVTHAIRVRCLPRDLPEHIDVDVTPLGLGQNLRVGDLNLDANKFQVLGDPETVIVTVVAPRVHEEPIAETPAEPEVIKKGKVEEKK